MADPYKKLQQLLVYGTDQGAYLSKKMRKSMLYVTSWLDVTYNCITEIENEFVVGETGKNVNFFEIDKGKEVCFKDPELANKWKKFEDIICTAVKNDLTDAVLLSHVLALCCNSPRLPFRAATHQILHKALITSDDLFRFLCLLNHIVKKNNPKAGIWGNGIRKNLCRWYKKQLSDPDLALKLLSHKSGYNWSHKDILKLIHFKPQTPQLQNMINYFIFEKRDARSLLENEYLTWADKFDELKKCVEPVKAVQLMTELKANPAALPPNYLSDPKIWAELVKTLPLVDVLNRLEFLTTSAVMSSALLPVLRQVVESAEGSAVDPAFVFVAYLRYVASSNFRRKTNAIQKLEDEKRRKERQSSGAVKKTKPKERPKVDTVLTSAINDLLGRSFQSLPKGNTNFLLILVYVNRCNVVDNVNGADIAALVAMYLPRIGRQTTVLVAGEGPIEYDMNASIHDHSAYKNRVILPQPIDEALEWGLNVDGTADTIVILYNAAVSDESAKRVPSIIKNYREKAGKPNARLVIVYLMRVVKAVWCTDDPGILIIRGFDANIGKLIHTFSSQTAL